MSKLAQIITRCEEKNFRGTSPNDGLFSSFQEISKILMNMSTADFTDETMAEDADKVIALALDNFVRSGRLCGAICQAVSLAIVFLGETSTNAEEFKDLLMSNLASIKLESFSSGSEDDETGLSNGPLWMAQCLATIAFFSTGIIAA